MQKGNEVRCVDLFETNNIIVKRRFSVLICYMRKQHGKKGGNNALLIKDLPIIA